MIKKILTVFIGVIICSAGFFSCKKVSKSPDPTRNYFPLTLGKYVIYNVDSTYYDTLGLEYKTHCRLMYAITGTDTNTNGQVSYLLNVSYQPYAGSGWSSANARVIYVTPTANSLLYAQDGTNYVKLMFPVQNGITWPGNQYAEVQDSLFSYLKNWNYTYQNYHLSYFNGFVNYDNTVTVQEDDENVNYQNVDSLVGGYKTYAKEVYAYNVGMVYKEWTHYTWSTADTSKIKKGYSVIMRAVENN